MVPVRHPKDISLFLGAGASAPFDYAPTGPFLRKFKADLSRDHGEFIDDLLSLDHVKDIEHIIEILDSRARITLILNKIGKKYL